MKQQKTSLVFSVAAAAFLTTGVAQAELSNNDIFSLLEEASYPSESLAGAGQNTLSDADKAALLSRISKVFGPMKSTATGNGGRCRVVDHRPKFLSSHTHHE